jgi:hypothetical protein
MSRTSALVMRGIVAFAVFAIENAASAQTLFSSEAGIFPPLPQWLSPLQPQAGAGRYQTLMHVPAMSLLRNSASAGVPAFQLGSRDEDRPAGLPANQSGGVCRARSSARSLDLQRDGFAF